MNILNILFVVFIAIISFEILKIQFQNRLATSQWPHHSAGFKHFLFFHPFFFNIRFLITS